MLIRADSLGLSIISYHSKQISLSPSQNSEPSSSINYLTIVQRIRDPPENTRGNVRII